MKNTFNSTLAGKGAMLSDTKTILAALETGQDLDSIRSAVAEGVLVDRFTRRTRENIWREVFRRYISERNLEHVRLLAQMVTHSSNSSVSDLVLLFEYCQVDDLLYNLTAQCTYKLYHDAHSSIDKVDINEWLNQQEDEHPEITEWSPATRRRIISSYLSSIRDFGLVKGKTKKEFYKFYVPRKAFVYALYYQKDRGLQGKRLIDSADWRIFLMNKREVIFMLEDATDGGFVRFRHTGDIYDLRFVYDNLSEVVDVLVD
jgi:hypothetical protein